jgi:hypothetical protein
VIPESEATKYTNIDNVYDIDLKKYSSKWRKLAKRTFVRLRLSFLTFLQQNLISDTAH